MTNVTHSRRPPTISLGGEKQSRGKACRKISWRHLIVFLVIVNNVQMMNDPLEQGKVGWRKRPNQIPYRIETVVAFRNT